MKLEALVSRHYDELNPNVLLSGGILLKIKNKCLNMTIEALAQFSNVSRSTVMRFARRLAYAGYSELKHVCALNWKKTKCLCHVIWYP